jgi:hypothetical protein
MIITDRRAQQRVQSNGKEAGPCNLFEVGSRVRVTSYSPFRGLRGTILKVDTIAADLDEPFCFYLVSLEGAHIREPIWFEYDEVEFISSSSVASSSRD